MRALLTVLLLFTSVASNDAMAVEIEKFLMPGEVISGHKKFEAECTLCHVRLRDTTQKKLCLDCHDLIAVDIESKRGFHGKNPNAISQDCKNCHGDHRGRDASIVSLDSDNFNHLFTDFALTGQHLQTECSACHRTDSKHRMAKKSCHSCHSDDDAHAGKLGKKCASCHSPDDWNKSGFDHDKTDFRLEFSHRQVPCTACHLKNNYKNTPQGCSDCHAIKDIHANRFGDKCEQCHLSKKWSQTSFEHYRDTGFSLQGGHRGRSCKSCHAPGYAASMPAAKIRSCYSCHRGDDIHKRSNGKKCNDCHQVKGWHLTVFDHAAKTRFPLHGGHAYLVCAACHIDGVDNSKLQTDCISCHRQDDVHQQALGETCDRCHNDKAWPRQIRFDHDLGNFPLLGQHAALGCEACHSSFVFTEAKPGCSDCHREDDVHKNSLGKNCAQCHNPNAWLIWSFDHDDTRFRLRDSHEQIHCQSCHDKPLDSFSGGSWRCLDCHRRDDIHEGNFGARCDRCHTEKSFAQPEIQSLKTFELRSDQSGRTPQ